MNVTVACRPNPVDDDPIAGASGDTIMKTHLHQRLGAFGLTAALGIFGGSAVLQKCGSAPKQQATAVSAPLAISDMLSSVNAVRSQNGLPALAENLALDMAAIDHSTDMAQRRTMTHTGWNGSNTGQRIKANGYASSTWGENVAAGQASVAEVMSSWMNSPGHAANILSAAFAEIGFAAVTGSNGTTYWTMVLATGR
jgi:uncharacterized protein YkwD